MPEVYGIVVWGGLCLSILTPVALFAVFQRRLSVPFVARIGILILSIFVCVLAGTFTSFLTANELQASIAIPYIQRALQNQCPEKRLVANKDGFKVGSTINWVSEKDNVVCFFNNVEWQCDCHS